MTPPTNPHAELVEALRQTNGWTYIEKDRWRCTKCAGPVLSMCGPPSILSHFADCPIRLALEYTPPPVPKLTPLPNSRLPSSFESIIKQQENTVKSQSEPAFALQERSIESKVNWLIEKVGLLTGLQSNVGSRLDALESNIKHHESGIDEYGNPLTDTFADRLRHLERKVFQLETEQSQRLGSLLEARDKQDAKPKPACDKCGDTKIINQGDDTHGYMRIIGQRLCPCVKVGDVVSRDVAMLLPIHSKVRETTFKGVGCAIKVRDGERAWAEDGKETGFDNDPFGFNGPFPLKTGAEFVILRIGPAPEATTDHVADASKKVEPDRAEEIARECADELWALRPSDWDGSRDCIATVLRRLRVGQLPPLADLPDNAEDDRVAEEILERCRATRAKIGDQASRLWWGQTILNLTADIYWLAGRRKAEDIPLADLIADQRLRPYWDVIKAAVTCRSPMSSGCDISVHVDALPPELRAAIESVK